MNPFCFKYKIIIHISRLLTEKDDDLQVRGKRRTHQHVYDVDYVETDNLPHLDLLVEENEDEVHHRHLRMRAGIDSYNVRDDVAEERERIHSAFAHEGYHTSNDCGDEQTRAQI